MKISLLISLNVFHFFSLYAIPIFVYSSFFILHRFLVTSITEYSFIRKYYFLALLKSICVLLS